MNKKMHNQTKDLSEQVVSAYQNKQSILIQGGASKSFLHDEIKTDNIISLSEHRGIINYLPSELTITARAGTLLSDINDELASKGQMLAFEPPAYSPQATLGGMMASGLSGLRRPYTGAVRDFVLGCDIINGKGDCLHFGGEVMKNVAGYDVSRLMVGAYGSLGIITQLSLKILPLPNYEQSLGLSLAAKDFSRFVHQLIKKGYPVSASCHIKQHAYIRLSGSKLAVIQAAKDIEQLGEVEKQELEPSFWSSINEQSHEFFADNRNLWRISLPMIASIDGQDSLDFLSTNDQQLLDWGGACRWVYTDMEAETFRKQIVVNGGTAQLFRDRGQYDKSVQRQHPLEEPILKLHQRIKNSFDPERIFNPSILYSEL